MKKDDDCQLWELHAYKNPEKKHNRKTKQQKYEAKQLHRFFKLKTKVSRQWTGLRKENRRAKQSLLITIHNIIETNHIKAKFDNS